MFPKGAVNSIISIGMNLLCHWNQSVTHGINFFSNGPIVQDTTRITGVRSIMDNKTEVLNLEQTYETD
jgi:hypothetical protein